MMVVLVDPKVSWPLAEIGCSPEPVTEGSTMRGMPHGHSVSSTDHEPVPLGISDCRSADPSCKSLNFPTSRPLRHGPASCLASSRDIVNSFVQLVSMDNWSCEVA